MNILKRILGRMLPKKTVPIRVPIRENYDDVQVDIYLIGLLDCE